MLTENTNIPIIIQKEVKQGMEGDTTNTQIIEKLKLILNFKSTYTKINNHYFSINQL